MKVYKVYDYNEEFEIIVGEKQLCEFAESQVYNAYDDFIDENLSDNKNKKTIIELVNKISESDIDTCVVETSEQAKMLLEVRCYDIEEYNVY